MGVIPLVTSLILWGTSPFGRHQWYCMYCCRGVFIYVEEFDGALCARSLTSMLFDNALFILWMVCRGILCRVPIARRCLFLG